MAATQDNSGAATPQTNADEDIETGEDTPMTDADATPQAPLNLAQASKSLSKLVLEKNMAASNAALRGVGGGAPAATYTNIESAPTLAPTKHYCDITGLQAPYTDPKTRLRYHDKETFAVVRGLGQGVAEMYLEARGAHTVLK